VNSIEAVHDDKASVDGILAVYGIWSSKNLWHKCKSLCSKFREDLVKMRREAIASQGEVRAPACDLKTMTVDKLKAFLKENNLYLKGRKDALVDRVWTFLEKVEEEVKEDSRLLRYSELGKHAVADKLKTHIYTCCKARAVAKEDNVTLLKNDIFNAADHWAGDHSVCALNDPTRKCVLEKRGPEKALYSAQGETHIAVKAWLEKKCTLSKLKHYSRARENFLSETFHSVTNKYAPKRFHFAKSHKSRIAAAALDLDFGRDRSGSPG
jgi:hypothetical protein